MDTFFIQRAFSGLLSRARTSPSGWMSTNCVACIHNGEPSPDTQNRLGVMFNPDGAVSFHCFRCNYKATWRPGFLLTHKIEKLFTWFGSSNTEVKRLALQCLSLQNEFVSGGKKDTIEYSFNFNEAVLPENAKPFSHYINLEQVPKSFLDVCEYMVTRNEGLLDWFTDYYWSNEMPDRFIIPLKYQKRIYGWAARLARPQKNKNEPKYLLENNSKFLFGADQLLEPYRKYIILVEGALDAIALNGMAVLGNHISTNQINLINDFNKKIIVLPDRDEGGVILTETAIKEGWSVSLPSMKEYNLKDGFDLVNHFGRITALQMVFDNIETSPDKIRMKLKSWL